MNRIASILIAMCPFTLSAHPCPFDWNVEFANDTEIKGSSLGDFVVKFNDAVKKETNNGITRAIIYDAKPDTFQKVPENSPYSKEMDALFKRYVEVMGPLMKKGYGESAPIALSIPAKFPVACLLIAQFQGGYGGATNYEETKEGVRVTRQREILECRAYQVSAKFLETVREWQSEDRIAVGVQPASSIFASFSGMTWAFDIYSESAQDYVQESFLDGVTHYLPEEKVILAIQTKNKHVEMIKVMTERGLLAVPVQDGSGPKKEAPQGGTGQPTTAPEFKPEGGDKPQPDAEGHSR